MLKAIKEVYEKQSIRLLEAPPEEIPDHSEVLVIIDVRPKSQPEEKDTQPPSLGTTFSGKWVDDRSAEEIIADIRGQRLE